MITVGKIAQLVGASVPDSETEIEITGVAALLDAVPGEISFFGNRKYLAHVRKTRATAVFVPLDFNEECAAILIRVQNPSLAFEAALKQFAPPALSYPPGVHPSAVIGKNVQLGQDVSIQPFVVLEDNVIIGDRTVIGAHTFIGHSTTIGSDTTIHPHVTIRERCVVANRVILYSGAVIGNDGFGYEMVQGKYVKIPQTGIVQIDDDVEIGANTTIDRARFGRTWIQEGTKIDNLVQIAHNVVIGRHSIIVAQAGIAGSSRTGNYVTIAGQVGVVGHVEIGDKAIIAAQSGISKDIPAGETWFGSPAAPMKQAKARVAMIARLPEWVARIRKLEKNIPPSTE